MRQRLLAFGCSFTYGHGLEDCVTEDLGPGFRPSKYAWPEILARKADAQCVNLSDPGASNKEIWDSVVNTNYTSRDTVIVLWTYPDRWAVITEDGNVPIRPWDQNKQSKLFYSKVYNEHDLQVDFNLRMHHTHSLLSAMKVPNYHCVFSEDLLIREKWNTVPITSSNMEQLRKSYKKATDNQHPGPLAHIKFAEELYKKITEKK